MSKITIAVVDTNAVMDVIYPEYFDINNIQKSEIYGHGTAVCSIIRKYSDNSEIELYPIFCNETLDIEVELVISVLEYIYNYSNCKIVNLSMGIESISSGDRKHLKDICDKLYHKGIVIVSGYSNEGLMSYPGCFSSVIGVATYDAQISTKEFIWLENSPINILGSSRLQRVRWNLPPFVFVSGSSFIVPYIVSLIAEFIFQCDSDVKMIYEYLKGMCVSSKTFMNWNYDKNRFEIKNAIMFPFSKEEHAIARFSKNLIFNLVGIFDVRHSKNVNKHISEILHEEIENDILVKNVCDINWMQGFDTIIIGHCENLVNVIGNDFLKVIVQKAKSYNKNIYTYDNYIKNEFLRKSKIDVECFHPQINSENIPDCQLGKMWRIDTPVVGVFGTSSKQGKFTLQHLINNQLKDSGYSVKHLSTEATGYLWGDDFVFSCGYNSDIEVSHEKSILILNKIMHELDCSGADLILTGGQSGLIPYDLINYKNITMMQTAFLYGVDPDAVVLCVNPYDELDYIDRTIKFLESSTKSKVVTIVVFPVLCEPFLFGKVKNINLSGTEQIKKIIDSLKVYFKIPVFELDKRNIFDICECIISFFS